MCKERIEEKGNLALILGILIPAACILLSCILWYVKVHYIDDDPAGSGEV